MAKKLSKAYFLISAKNIHLDTENPRHDYKENEQNIILSLCDEKLLALARDVVKIGSLSPLEVIGVIPSKNTKGHYVALEGNRRTCALILLADPSRAPGDFKERFEKISKTNNFPKELLVYIFVDRDDAQPWLDRRHMGEQGGVGTSPWDAKAQARRASKDKAEKSTAHANVLALSVIDRLLSIKKISADQKEKLSITTLARYLNNSHRQKIIGISGLSIDGEIIYSHNPSVVDGILQRLCIDSIPVNKKRAIVHSRANAKECADYLIEIASGKINSSTRIDPYVYDSENREDGSFQNSILSSIEGEQEFAHHGSTKLVAESSVENHEASFLEKIDKPPLCTNAMYGEGNESDAETYSGTSLQIGAGLNKSSQNVTAVIRGVRDKSNRIRIIETAFCIPVADKVLVRLRKEMLALDTEGHEFAVNYLLRAFVERVLVMYYRKKIPTRKYDNDLQLTQRCAQDAQQEQAPRNIQDILNQAAANTHIAHSLYTLGTAIHGGTFPNRRQLNAVFDTWEPALKYMLEIISVAVPDPRARQI